MDFSKEGLEKVEKLKSLLDIALKDMKFKKPSEILYDFCEKSGYFSYLTTKTDVGSAEASHDVVVLRKFFNFVKDFETKGEIKDVRGFLEYYEDVLASGDGRKVQEEYQSEEDRVQIMTMHASKGLEFKFVFVVNLVEDRFPARARSESLPIPENFVKEKGILKNDAYLEEERRLFYVALTRAKEKLYLTASKNYGGVRLKKLSRFLNEIGIEDIYQNNDMQKNLMDLLDDQKVNTKNDRIKEYKIPKKFSFSQIKAYLTCPYQYKLTHILQLPTRGSGTFSFGTSMHGTLQRFYEIIIEKNKEKTPDLFDLEPIKKEMQIPSKQELLQIYEEKFIPDNYPSEEERILHFQKGKDILNKFYDAEEKNGWNVPISLEEWFCIKIGKYLVHGRIDRIDKLEDGTLEIVDYKTGKTKQKIEGDDKDQLLLYQIALKNDPKHNKKGETSKLSFFYLNDLVKTSFIGTPKEIEKLEEKINEVGDNIVAQKFKATPSKFACDYCDFRNICEFRET
jgi:DNA helicase-2/ATP-dependent DNA helicase PcrA